MIRTNYEGQIFGTRKIIRDYCVQEDWINIGKTPPRSINKNKYRLGECQVCFQKIPSLVTGLIKYPPKGCSFCTGINHSSNIKLQRNIYSFNDEICKIDIIFKKEIIECFIDIDDYDRVKNHNWRISKKRNKYYAVCNIGPKKNVYMHSFILNKEIPSGYEIDHKDGNSLHNMKHNLRIISRFENIVNTSVRIDNKIGIRGITKSGKKYQVDFSYNKKRYKFNKWDTLQEAIYCRKFAEEYFNLEIIKYNIAAQQYLNLQEEEQKIIKDHVIFQISGN